tara:strand:- start:154 stop:606 length:453 start_codon:yes stop_codon:yes gene_type:complete
MKVEKLLKNQNVLYLVIALAILCSLGYVCVSSYECLAIFAIVFFISCNFIKNKIVCILVALFVSNFVFGCSMSFKGSFFEGYSNPVLSPVSNTTLAHKINNIVKVAGEKAGQAAAEASANQGGGPSSQQKERRKAAEEVKKAVVEEFSNM